LGCEIEITTEDSKINFEYRIKISESTDKMIKSYLKDNSENYTRHDEYIFKKIQIRVKGVPDGEISAIIGLKNWNFDLKPELLEVFALPEKYSDVNDPNSIEYLEKEEDIEELIKELSSQDIIRFQKAKDALTQISKIKTLHPLMELLKKGNELDRENAAEILGIIGDKMAVKSLIRSLKDDSFYVRKSAVEALGKMGDKRAIPSLKRMLNDPKPSIQKKTKIALEMLGFTNY